MTDALYGDLRVSGRLQAFLTLAFYATVEEDLLEHLSEARPDLLVDRAEAEFRAIHFEDGSVTITFDARVEVDGPEAVLRSSEACSVTYTIRQSASSPQLGEPAFILTDLIPGGTTNDSDQTTSREETA